MVKSDGLCFREGPSRKSKMICGVKPVENIDGKDVFHLSIEDTNGNLHEIDVYRGDLSALYILLKKSL